MKYIEKSYEKLFEEFEQLDHILTFTFFMFISDWTIYHKKILLNGRIWKAEIWIW